MVVSAFDHFTVRVLLYHTRCLAVCGGLIDLLLDRIILRLPGVVIPSGLGSVGAGLFEGI